MDFDGSDLVALLEALVVVGNYLAGGMSIDGSIDRATKRASVCGGLIFLPNQQELRALRFSTATEGCFGGFSS